MRRAGLSQVLEQPRLVFPRLHAHLGMDSGKPAKFLEAAIRARSAANHNGIVGARIVWLDALYVGVNHAIHRPIERLVGLHSSVENPSPGRLLLYLAVWRLA